MATTGTVTGKPDGVPGTDPDGTDPDGTDPDGTDPDGTDPDGTDPDADGPDGAGVRVVDLATSTVRELNRALHAPDLAASAPRWRVTNPQGRHNLAVGLDAEVSVQIEGHVGYYCAGMSQHATVTVHGNAGVGVAENLMSGTVRVRGNASQSAAATAHGGLLVVEGSAAARCAISLKGADVVVGGDIGHMGAFLAQAGRLVVCGDAGHGLGDSVYETRIYVRGTVASLGADCVAKPMRPEHLDELAGLLTAAGIDADPATFRRYGSARTLYTFHPDNAAHY